MRIFPKLFEQSLLLRLGAAMAAITLLGVIGMASAIIIAGITQGNAETINLAGSLRMQSYRIASLTLVAQHQNTAENWKDVENAIQLFEHSLRNSTLRRISLPKSGSTSTSSYQTITSDWQAHLKPKLIALIKESQLSRSSPQRDTELLNDIGIFVAQIDHLVKSLAQQAENRITLLSTILGISLFLTLLVVFGTIYVMHADVLIPLRELLTCARNVGRGDLTVRIQHTGKDELGRLGEAFNSMAEDLARLYQNLEARVAEKTAELSRSNRSLELLYHTIARLYNGPIARDTYAILLKDIESVLEIGHGSACLLEGDAERASVLASTFAAKDSDADLCKASSCADCLGDATIHQRVVGDEQRTILALPLMDAERQHGVLQLEIPKGRKLEAWQMQLLEALCLHIGTAIGTARKTEQNRRVSLLEERAVIARELHDSLAQSLSFMKIQVSRLQAALGTNSPSEAGKILAELRQGLNGAYRELRELLTTFRLKIEGTGLSAALQETVAEFSSRGDIPIQLDAHLTGCRLSANEEIHVLQIIREALSNVLHHAKARQGKVIATFDSDGILSASVEDDGIGFNDSAGIHHYGMAIMQERARSLGGKLETENRATGGARVSLSFKPAANTELAPVQFHGLAL